MSDATTEIGKNDEEPSSLSVYNALDRPSIGVQQPSWHRYVPGPNYARYRKSLDARWMRAGTVACGGGCLMLSGYNLALMGNVSATPSYLKVVNLDDGSPHTELIIGTLNSMYWIGVLIGALAISPISDTFGRRKALVLTGIYGLLVIPIFAGLQNFSWALVLCLLNGVATGAFDSVGLNWSAETADHRYRGRIIGIEMVCAACGASQAYFLVYGLNKDTTSQLVWRLPLGFQLLFLLFVLVLAFVLPESPRWLLRNGHVQEAKDVLFSLHADEDDASVVSTQVDFEIASIQRSLEEELCLKQGSSYLHMLFSNDRYKIARRSWSAIFVQFACQAMVGADVASGYGMKIFMMGGWSADLSSLLAGMGIVTQAVFGGVGAALADKLGRRRAMIYGSGFGSVVFAMISLCGHYIAKHRESDPALAQKYSKGVIALVFLWSAQFGLTWLWTPFTYPSEIFPGKYRAKGSSFSIVGLATGNFFINMVSPYIFSTIASNSLFLFSGLSALVTIICLLFMPETANKTLEEIGNLFN